MTILFDESDNFTGYSFDDEKKLLIQNVISEVLKFENFTQNVEISFSIVLNSEIREINNKFRGIDKVTDVLSFPLIDFGSFETLPDLNGTVFLGDIVLSIEKAISQADEYGHSIEREIAFLTVHSVLHLLGYDHLESNEEIIMFSKQEQILNNLNIKR